VCSHGFELVLYTCKHMVEIITLSIGEYQYNEYKIISMNYCCNTHEL